MQIWKDRFFITTTEIDTSRLKIEDPPLKVTALKDLYIKWIESDDYNKASPNEREYIRGYWTALKDLALGKIPTI